MPPSGMVPTADVAIKIADAVLVGAYGEKIIKSERPLVATLKDGVWIVGGTLPKGMMGGVAYIYLAKKTGRVVRLFHEQ